MVITETGMKHWMIGALLMAYAMTSLADDFGHDARHRPVRVFDANNRVVGDLTIFAAENGVALSVGDATAVIPVQRVQDSSGHFSATEFRWFAYTSVQYTSSDCSGDPILDSTYGPRSALVFRQGNQVIVYFAAPGASQTVQANSTFDTSGCRKYSGPIPAFGWKVGATLSLSRDHPEPLRIGF